MIPVDEKRPAVRAWWHMMECKKWRAGHTYGNAIALDPPGDYVNADYALCTECSWMSWRAA